VELLGSSEPVTFTQSEMGLTVVPGGPVQPVKGMQDASLASSCRVLRITHDKTWINDDDLNVVSHGWLRRCHAGAGDYNNDLTTSDTAGDVWSCQFTGSSVTVVAPKEAGAGKIEVQIDGRQRAMADLSTAGARQPQQRVCRIGRLAHGTHTIAVINRGPGPVALDALIVD
jgi:hypothetical protein